MSHPTVPAMVLAGIGAHLPERVVTNDDLSSVMATSDEWISTRTGIRQRHWVEPGETTLDLAVEAGRAALKHHGEGTAIDAVVLATTTPDRRCPATAPEVAAALGLGTVPAFDVAAVCSGFVYAAATAQGLIAARTARTVLVIGAEAMSSLLYPGDRNVGVIFGDGAGAAVVRAGDHDEPGAFGTFDLGADGHAADLIAVNAGGGRVPHGTPDVAEQEYYLTMAGREVYRRSIPGMADSCRRVLTDRGWAMDDVDTLIGHQANVRILHGVARNLGLDADRCYVNIDRVGNTSAASIPIAMAHAHADGAVRAGDRVLVTAFGAGLTWGSTTLVWPDLPTP